MTNDEIEAIITDEEEEPMTDQGFLAGQYHTELYRSTVWFGLYRTTVFFLKEDLIRILFSVFKYVYLYAH